MNIGAWIFGLELNVLNQCPIAEKRKYNLLAYFFCLLILLGGVSFFYFFLLLSNSYFVASIGMIVLGFIYTSILRFSLVTIGVPLHEEVSFKRMTINSGNIFRLIVVSFFIFTLLVPFVSLLNHTEFTKQVESKKELLAEKYFESKEKSKRQQMSLLNSKLQVQTAEQKKINSELNSQLDNLDKGLLIFRLKKIDSSIVLLQNQVSTKDSLLTVNFNKDVKAYRAELNSIELPFLRLRLTLANKSSKGLVILLFMAFISIFPLYISFLIGKKSSYAKLIKLDRKQKIIDAHKKTIQETSDYLKRKFNYNYSINKLYEDSPFNTKRIFPPYTKLKDKTLFTHFENLNNE